MPAIEQLFVTSSGGVLTVDPQTGSVQTVVETRDRRWTGFFGIAWQQRSGTVIAASRQRLGTARVRKHSTDVTLYRIDPTSYESETVADLHDIHDVHQIAVWEDIVFLTDTGLNRIHVYDLAASRLVRIVEVGPERNDVNHLNALLVEEGTLLIGMNNRGYRDAALMKIPLEALVGEGPAVVDSAEVSEVIPLPGFEHTHDLERHREDLLACASHDGLVLRTDPPEVLFPVDGWSRGLAITGEGVWVGISQFAERKLRHTPSVSGAIILHEWPDGQPIRRIELEGVGQVHDLIAV
jgi:hypothetical protein